MLSAPSQSGANWVNHHRRLLANQDLNNRTKGQIKRWNRLQFGLRGRWSAWDAYLKSTRPWGRIGQGLWAGPNGAPWRPRPAVVKTPAALASVSQAPPWRCSGPLPLPFRLPAPPPPLLPLCIAVFCFVLFSSTPLSPFFDETYPRVSSGAFSRPPPPPPPPPVTSRPASSPAPSQPASASIGSPLAMRRSWPCKQAVECQSWSIEVQSTTLTERGYVSFMTLPTLVRWHTSPYAWNGLEQTQKTPISRTQASPRSETRTAFHLQKQSRTGSQASPRSETQTAFHWQKQSRTGTRFIMYFWCIHAQSRNSCNTLCKLGAPASVAPERSIWSATIFAAEERVLR